MTDLANNVQEIEEDDVYTIRPRFKIQTDLDPVELASKLKSGLEANGVKIKGRVIPGHALLYLPKTEQHYWSPQLTLSFEKEEEKTIVRGLFGPRPAVWTMFVFFYAVIGFATIVVGMVGLSYLSLEKPSNILWWVPALLVILLTIYLVANYGKKLGHDQMEVLHRFVQKSTGMNIALKDSE